MNLINVILAIDEKFGLGKNNKLPWDIKEELNIFKKKTLDSIVIVGRKTLENLPILKNRTIFCISKNFKRLVNNQNVVVLFLKSLFGTKEAIVPLSSESPTYTMEDTNSKPRYNLRERKVVNYAEDSE